MKSNGKINHVPEQRRQVPYGIHIPCHPFTYEVQMSHRHRKPVDLEYKTVHQDSQWVRQFSPSVMSNSLQPCGLQNARLPYPSPTPRACSNSCPLSRWCHPTILSSVVPFSSCLQSVPASGSFPRGRFFTSGGQIIGASLQHQSLQWIFRTDFL